MGTDVYIRHCKYQAKPHSSPYFSSNCAPAIAHRNQFFVCTNKIYLLNLKFRQASNCCKNILEAAKLAYANKT